MMRRPRLHLLGLLLSAPAALAAQPTSAATTAVPACATSAEWNTPHAPKRIFGNTYYVGTACLGAILITSDSGHVLIDGALPASAPLIAANIQALGFRLSSIRWLLNSHAHYDHAGGLAELQRRSGAPVLASAPSVRPLRAGASGLDDPQYGELEAFPGVADVRELAENATVRVGAVELVPHRTAGHTPGGTTWSWTSCEGERCLEIVYADSQSPISADGFLYSSSTTYPNAVQDFADGHQALERLQCDVLITPHPGGSSFWERMAAGDGASPALTDREACRRYAATARGQLARRLATEAKPPALRTVQRDRPRTR